MLAKASLAEETEDDASAGRFYEQATVFALQIPNHPQAKEIVQAYSDFLRKNGRATEAEELRHQHAERVAASPPPDLPDWLFEDMPEDDR